MPNAARLLQSVQTKTSRLQMPQRPHDLRAIVCYFCGLQCVGSIASSVLSRTTVSVFRVGNGTLSEVQCVITPSSDWAPGSLVKLPNTAISVRSLLKDWVHPYDKDQRSQGKTISI